jgi:tRNA-2-methylthio-N6-dimethylallyladenosine synthase
MNNKYFHIIRLGCASIQADGIKIASYLQKNGLLPSSEIEDADIIIILTCGFSYKQYNESIDTIRKINDNKKESAKIWIGGCIPAINKNFIQELPFDADLIFSPRNFEEVLNEYIKNQPFVFQTNNTIIDYNHDEVYPIRIINGCTENCTYCVIKRAGGKALSQPIPKLEKEIRNISNEIKCISLVGEDIGAYGKDINTSLEELIKLIVQIHPEIKIAFTTIHPKHFIQDFEMFIKIFETYHENLIPVLPVPIQSGSNTILKFMKRDYNIDDVLIYFQNFIDKFPEIKYQTDIMVGYPGETWNDFLLSKRIVEELPLSALSCFKFDDMTGIGNTVSEEEKIKRLKIISLAFVRNYCRENDIQNADDLKHALEKNKILLNINL